MAIIKFGQIIAEARGSLAGTVFSRNTAGSYMRQKISPVQPQTPAQLGVRALLTTVSQAWRGITSLQRLAWVTVAETFTNINVFGDNVPLTGFGLFVKLNRDLQTIGNPIISDPPLQQAVVGFDTLSLVVDNSEIVDDDKVQILFSPDVPGDQQAVVYMTAPLSPGINFVDSEYRKIAVMGLGQTSPFTLGDAYIAKFGLVPPVGAKSFVKIRPILDASGISGTVLSDSELAI